MSKNLFFIGFMGSGKTTISAAFSKKYNRKNIEADDIIKAREGMSIKDIFAQKGEPYFRDLETKLYAELAEMSDCVISCGGGSVCRPENVASMKRGGFVVLLEARPETILERVKDSDQRPVLNGNMNVEYIANLKQKRAAAYASAADIVVHTDDKTVDEVVEDVYQSIHRARQSSLCGAGDR